MTTSGGRRKLIGAAVRTQIIGGWHGVNGEDKTSGS